MQESYAANQQCKICHSNKLAIFAHTARCGYCGILLYYPYPELLPDVSVNRDNIIRARNETWQWYADSSFDNHDNFTDMLRFTLDKQHYHEVLNILDYGGGGGQFALVCKSHFPQANVYLTDINDMRLLNEWRNVNEQIPFKDFAKDKTQFDVIFLNDVFEHIEKPLDTLLLLADKLKPNGKIFIDTPKQFWLYSIPKLFSKKLAEKILLGTVSRDHLQIWSRKAFKLLIAKSGLVITKYKEMTEYTMPPHYYINRMHLTNPIIRTLAYLFYKNTKWLAKNKIMCVLAKNNV